MNETKSLRRRSLLAFIVPVLFAVFMMQPAQVGKLVDLSQPLLFTDAVLGKSDVAIPPAAQDTIQSILESRWCVRMLRQPEYPLGSYILKNPDLVITLLENQQYLTVSRPSQDFIRPWDTYIILGNPLCDEILPLLDSPEGLPAMEKTP